ncbi:MAG: FAD-dependent monooxygenase [Actinobacteria bacterium]|nr:FAD-dependent monooxygenase [Actinomycetota bacterium]
MSKSSSGQRIAIIGAGPAGMAAALSLSQTEHEVVLFERYKEARPAGNILNLWPPPIKALGLMGVDTKELGAPCQSEFRRADGKVRAVIHLPQAVIDEYRGGFIGMLRPQLYRRMLAALPDGVLRLNQQIDSFDQDETGVTLRLSDGSIEKFDVLVGADGIDSLVRKTLWGDSPKRDHKLHIFGGFTFQDVPGIERGRCVVSHTKTVQGSWTSIRDGDRNGYQWWVLEATHGEEDSGDDLYGRAAKLGSEFAFPLPELIAATDPADVQRWDIRDRVPMKQWSQGRVTLVGDAAHSTSPYAAYGAGMAIEDGYFLGRRLAGVDLSDQAAVEAALKAYEEPRKPHTKLQSNLAFNLGRVFHRAPALLRPLRDLVFDHTGMLQKVIGDATPGEIIAQLDEIDHAETAFRGEVASSAA